MGTVVTEHREQLSSNRSKTKKITGGDDPGIKTSHVELRIVVIFECGSMMVG